MSVSDDCLINTQSNVTVAWIVAALVIVINGYLLLNFFSSEVSGLMFTSIVSAFTGAYLAFIIYLVSRGFLTFDTP
ncbi:metal transporter Nramp3-like [Gossypium australe]|uniref:Metal transporter Nramp3-like n=1 Tax=Gossypium australe TaxID=47621 RepID=A0A5B6UYF9_9ROSI|nr:metal transporter Nramp3-like [Gossypium australe]